MKFSLTTVLRAGFVLALRHIVMQYTVNLCHTKIAIVRQPIVMQPLYDHQI